MPSELCNSAIVFSEILGKAKETGEKERCCCFEERLVSVLEGTFFQRDGEVGRVAEIVGDGLPWDFTSSLPCLLW